MNRANLNIFQSYALAAVASIYSIVMMIALFGLNGADVGQLIV